MGVKIFFQNFEEKCLIIILRPKWANLSVKQSFGRFIKSDVAISKIGLVPPLKFVIKISCQLKLVTTFLLKQSCISMVLEDVVVINPLALFQNRELVNNPFNTKVLKS